MDPQFLKREGWLVLLNYDQAMSLLLNLCHTYILLPTMTICRLKNDFKNDHSNSFQLRAYMSINSVLTF